VVAEYERAVIFRLGRLRKGKWPLPTGSRTSVCFSSGGAKGPGIFFIIPCVDSYKKVDLRTVSFDVPPQEVREDDPVCEKKSWPRELSEHVAQVLSRDSVTVSVDAVVYYRVSNPTMATNNIEDYRCVVLLRCIFSATAAQWTMVAGGQ